MSAVWSWDRATSKAPKGVNKSLGRPVNKTGYSYSIKGGPPPPRPPREFLESQSHQTAPHMREPQQPPRNRDSHLNRGSAFRPASSIYSQPSPVHNNFSSNVSGANHQYSGAPDEISPPSSPEPGYYTTSHGARPKRGQSRDVSPLDEGRHTMSNNARASPDPQSRSNIPMMRRARRKQSDAALREAHSKERPGSRQAQHKTDVRWDDMTGEPTSSETGKSSQVKPAEFARGLGASPPSAPTHQQRSPTAAITSFGDRVRRMAQGARGEKKEQAGYPEAAADPAANAFESSRPGWRGASGRTTLVEPVRDNPEVVPLKIPRKSSKRVTSPVSATGPNSNVSLGMPAGRQPAPAHPSGPETTAKSGPRETVRRVVPSSQMAAPVSSKQTTGPAEGLSYSGAPVPGSFDGADAPTVAARQLQSSLAGGSALDQHPALRRKPPPAHANHSHQESLSSVYSQDPQPPAPPPHGANPVSTGPGESWTQPPSRFSVTTFATSAAATTPRESFDTWDHDRPPMPTPPQQYRESPKPNQESVMDRQRPKLNGGGGGDNDSLYASGGSPIHISFKDSLYTSAPFSNPSSAARQRHAAATGGADTSYHATVARARTTAERPMSSASNASSINKMLPPAPPEATAGEARDRVGMLNAQLQSLGNRRINLNRSIKQMTELMPQDNVLDSADVIHKREMEKRKVEVLRQELSDVQRQEYELGLKLHRAYKRMDRDADWENSALWVRRVTG